MGLTPLPTPPRSGRKNPEASIFRAHLDKPKEDSKMYIFCSLRLISRSFFSLFPSWENVDFRGPRGALLGTRQNL